MTLEFQDRPSPNYDERRAPLTMLVLHYTGTPNLAESFHHLTTRAGRVSSHYLVDEDGTIYRLVAEDNRAWHAGISYWRGETDINSTSIGIEIQNPGHEWGLRAFPETQFAAVEALCLDIVQRYAIHPHDVIAHSDIAPLRRFDPGELFDWERLANKGVGQLPPQPVFDPKSPFLTLGDEGREVQAYQAALQRYGYGLAPSGVYDYETQAVTLAFQRHFRRSRVDGLADAQTRAILNALIGV
jgi:N-acetylmuramoyl-L-alanine amidase